MLRVVCALFVVINVVCALWLIEGYTSSGQASVADVPMIQGSEIILLREVDESSLVEIIELVIEEEPEEMPERESEIEAVLEPKDAQCMQAGYFSLQKESQALADRLESLGIDVEIQNQKIETPGPFMVYIKPFVSSQEALRELRVLRASNVDSFIISDGDLVNGISLGVFSTEQNALTQQTKIEALGYKADISQFMQEEDRFVVFASGEVLNALTEEYWLKLADEYKGISIQEKACNEVASMSNFQ